MENRAYALITGVFVIAIAAGIVIWANWLAGRPVQRAKYRVVALYPVTGLNEQAQVRYRGIDVGRVTKIQLDKNNPNRILIDIEVNKDVPISRGTYAQLGMEGITGIAYVHLLGNYVAGEAPPKGRDGVPEIHLRPSFLDTLADNAEAVLRDGRALLAELTKLVNEENRTRISSSLAHLDTLLSKLETQLPGFVERTDERVQAWLNEKNRRNVEDTLANLKSATQELPALVGETRALVRDARALSAQASELAAQATALAHDSRGAVHDVRDTTLPKVNALADSVERSARRVGDLAEELERDPHSLIWGRGAMPPGPGEEGFQ